MDFADAITIVVAGPFLLTVADRRMRPNDMVVALPFIGIDRDPGLGEGVDMVSKVAWSV
jgi:hypothetical protein